MNEFQRRATGGIGIAVMTALPLSAHAGEVIKIDADIPALIQIAKDNKDVVLKLAQQTASAVHIIKFRHREVFHAQRSSQRQQRPRRALQ